MWFVPTEKLKLRSLSAKKKVFGVVCSTVFLLFFLFCIKVEAGVTGPELKSCQEHREESNSIIFISPTVQSFIGGYCSVIIHVTVQSSSSIIYMTGLINVLISTLNFVE